MSDAQLCLDEEEPVGFKLRGRQPEWIDAIERDERTYRRLLVVAPGGIGKSSVMGFLAARKWRQQGIRTLITENREHLTEQTAGRIRQETGLEVDVEMASSHASPYAPIVVGSVQSLGRPNRLTGFAPNHFGMIIPDECHFCLAPQPMRILNYFHVGAESLTEGWVRPADGLYVPLSTVAGFTASPDIGERRNLGEFFQHQSVNYSYLDALEDGWLVGIREENIPVKVDTTKFRRKQTSEGADFNASDQSAALIPIIRELAEQIVCRAKNRKTICFLPSVECSRLMAAALNSMGMRAIFVSGECLDKSEKTDAYNSAGPGTVLVNCALVAYGIDFPDTDCIAIFSAVISKANYIQKIYRGTRVLPGTVSDAMTADERRAAIAASRKPYLLVLSPFFVSDRIKICEIYDLFGNKPDDKKAKKMSDFTEPAKIRDYIKALEKAADKHAHRQPRTVNPVALSLMLKMPHYEPQSSQDAEPPTKIELDYILAMGADSSAIKTSGEAQALISVLRERDRLGRATPLQLTLLVKLGLPEETAVLMRKGQAGAIIGSRTAAWRR
jgi:superfamily II DNA or RNA helicase